jgi:hypothetical protein
MQEEFQFMQRGLHLGDGRRDEASRGGRWATDPVLGTAEFTWSLRGFAAADSVHQSLVNLANKPER